MTHHVERAIIMAAGQGTRMRPITNTIPKPLVSVNGTRMIDTVIQALQQQGITEIYVVVGYLKEKFLGLDTQYPEVTIVENPYYDTCNNISSLYVVRDKLENAMILDGDQLIFQPEILNPTFNRSGYNAVWVEEQTDEWLMQVDEQQTVTACSRNGGEKGWQLYSISRWNAADGRKLAKHLEIEFDEKKNRDIYWDDVAMFCYPHEYSLTIYPMKATDIVEIDNLSELIALDNTYATWEEKSND